MITFKSIELIIIWPVDDCGVLFLRQVVQLRLLLFQFFLDLDLQLFESQR